MEKIISIIVATYVSVLKFIGYLFIAACMLLVVAGAASGRRGVVHLIPNWVKEQLALIFGIFILLIFCLAIIGFIVNGVQDIIEWFTMSAKKKEELRQLDITLKQNIYGKKKS